MHGDGPGWPPPTGSPVGTSGWYLASDGVWYRSSGPPAPGYLLAADGRWRPLADADAAASETAWRSSRWGLGDVWWGALVWLVVGIASGIVIAVARDGTATDEADLGVWTNSALIAVNVLALAGIPWLATRRKGLRSLRLDFGLRGRWTDVAVGAGFGLAALIAAGVVANAIDAALDVDEATSNIPVDRLGGVAQFTVFFLATAVVTPIIEELFFRGLVFRSFLKRGATTTVCVAATTAIFVVPHLLAADSLASLVTLTATIAVLGVAFNLACHLTDDRLVAPIVAHAIVNGVAVIALAFG